MLLAVVLGPHLLGLLVIPENVRDPLLLEGTRPLLAGSVMAAALRFPATALRSLVGPLVLILVVVMPLAAAVTGCRGARARRASSAGRAHRSPALADRPCRGCVSGIQRTG